MFFGARRLTRRHFLKNSALAASALTLPLAPFRARAAAPLKPVNMTLDWIYEGPNLGFLVAHDQGFYRDAGLDVAITAGKGSGNTAQLVASKATQIGFADGYAVSNGISQGHGHQDRRQHLPRQSRRPSWCLRDSGHQDAEGSRRQDAGDDRGQRSFQQWPAFVKGAGIDAAKINIVNLTPPSLGPALISGKVDAIGGYVQSYVPIIEIRGKKQVARLLVFRLRRQRGRPMASSCIRI